MKKWLIVGGIALVLFILACGFGGYSLLRAFQNSAKNLAPEFARAERNKIPLTFDAVRPDRALPPNENAALEYKKAFDIWAKARPLIDDSRWESYVSTTEPNDDTRGVDQIVGAIVEPIQQASELEKAQWQIDYSDRAFGTYPVFAGVVDGVSVWIKSQGHRDDGAAFISSQGVTSGFRISDHLSDSGDPGSLRAASAVRLEILGALALELPLIGPGLSGVTIVDQYKSYAKSLDSFKPIDPLPVWRRTAFLQFDTWEHFDDLTDGQRELFGGARRDDAVMIDAASTQIVKFWNDAIESAEGKTALEQYTMLGESVLRLRDQGDVVSVPLKVLWTLDSATKGAGSLDWILANEQLMLMKQALDILVAAEGTFPNKFDCKRVSVIGMKPYTYEKTATGFKISAKPSEILAPQSMLAQQNFVYEFRVSR